MSGSKDKAKSRKRVAAVVISVVLLFVLSGLGVGITAAVMAFAPVKIVIDEGKTYQTIEGFGFSGAWTFQELGASAETADKAAQLLVGEDGLNMDVIRYNIGAGSIEVAGHDGDPTERRTESFFISENFRGDNAAFADPSNYDFETRDAKAMRMLKACIEKGNIKTLVLFANSPHYLLTSNGMCKGGYLPKENYGAFADQLLVTAGHFYELYGKDVRIYLSPVNEPQWGWDLSSIQEGCHYESEAMAEFCTVFLDKLDEYNSAHGTEILPELFDSGTYDVWSNKNFKNYIDALNSHGVTSRIDHVALHSYHAGNSAAKRKRFVRYAKKNLTGKAVHMSEFCVMEEGIDPSIDMGLKSLDVMLKDLTALGANQWCWWLGASNVQYEDGLIYYNSRELKENGNCDFTMTKRYSCFAQVTRYVQSGDIRIEAHTSPSTGGGVLADMRILKRGRKRRDYHPQPKGQGQKG